MSDLINRQDAIDAIEKLDIPEDMCVFEILSHIELAIGTLPSAQPDDHHKLNIAEYIHDFYPDVWRHAEKELEVASAERIKVIDMIEKACGEEGIL